MGDSEFPDPRPYRQIADRFRQQIIDGVLRPGDALPSIADIRRDSGHSRQTVSKAMRLLADEGLVFQTPGHPYCVTGNASALGTTTTAPSRPQVTDESPARHQPADHR